MAVKTLTVEQFAKGLHRMSDRSQSIMMRLWDVQTRDTNSLAQKMIPIASGALMRANEWLRARVTPTGVESFIVNNMPYAERIHDDPTIRLKNKGEVSYRRAGGIIKKQRKGSQKWVPRAIKFKARKNDYENAIFKAIDKMWDAV